MYIVTVFFLTLMMFCGGGYTDREGHQKYHRERIMLGRNAVASWVCQDVRSGLGDGYEDVPPR